MNIRVLALLGTLAVGEPEDVSAESAEDWQSQDVGSVGVAGGVEYTDRTDVFTLRGSGTGITGSSDGFQFVHRTLEGNGWVVARVKTISESTPWAKAGVMLRSGEANGAYALMFATSGDEIAFQRRREVGKTSLSAIAAVDGAATPRWVKLEREDDVISAYASSDGVDWSLVGRDWVDLGVKTEAGLALTSHVNDKIAMAGFEGVSAVGGQWALPLPWLSMAIAPDNTRACGGGVFRDQGFAVTGLGADIWGTADEFEFVYQPLEANGEIVTRIGSMDPTDPWAKAGVMLRHDLNANSANVSLFATPGNGVILQNRPVRGAVTLRSGSGDIWSEGVWLKLVRMGEFITASWSVDGENWTIAGVERMGGGENLYAGVAVSSHNTSRVSRAIFENTAVTPEASDGPLPDPWTENDVGDPVLSGEAGYYGGTYLVTGSGDDIWNRSDQFHFVSKLWSGDGELVAEVESLQNTSSWAKAGVMFRENLLPESRHVFATVTRANGVAFQRRAATGGETVHTGGGNPIAEKPPRWVKLKRVGNLFSAFYSADGSEWNLLGEETIILPSTIEAGLAVTSHDPDKQATSVLTHVKLYVPGDSDADGIPDEWETEKFGNLNSGPSGNGDGDSLSNYDEWQTGSDPQDFFNGERPSIEIVFGDDQRTSPGNFAPAELVVRVLDPRGTPYRNAPVRFVAEDEARLSGAADGSLPLETQLDVKTDSSGYASNATGKVFVKLPETQGPIGILVKTGTVSARLTAVAESDTDADGMPDDYEYSHQLNPWVDDAMDDPDDDKVPNIFEYKRDTDPQDATSRPPADLVVGPELEIATISAALELTVEDYRIIEVLPGSYSEAFAILYHKVALISRDGPFVTSLVTNAVDTDVLSVWQDSVIEGFSIYHTEPGTGGAVQFGDDLRGRLSRCVIGPKNGPGLFVRPGSRVVVENTLFKDNAGFAGAAIGNWDSKILVRNCTFLGNQSELGGDTLWNVSDVAESTLVNCIIWNGFNGELLGENISVSYSVFWGGIPGEANLDFDPKVSANGQLAADSPAINAGLTSAAPLTDLVGRRRGVQSDLGALENSSVDSDADDLPDYWEMEKFGNLEQSGAGDADGDGYSNLDEYFAQTDPNVYFFTNGVAVEVITGDRQLVSLSQVTPRPLVVRVLDADGGPIGNAPVLFTASLMGGAGLSLSNSDQISVQQDIVIRTDRDGYASHAREKVFVKMPDFEGDVTIVARAGGASVADPAATVTFTMISKLDSDGDGMPDEYETVNQLDPNRDDAMDDRDDDQIPNLYEYARSTDPLSAASRPPADFVVGQELELARISDALAQVSQDYAIIEVRPGTYVEAFTVDRYKVAIVSQNGPTLTTITTEATDTDVLSFWQDAVLEGFSITHIGEGIGGGISFGEGIRGRISRCIIGPNFGVGLFARPGSFVLVENTLFKNNAAYAGAAIGNWDAEIMVRSGTFVGNRSDLGGDTVWNVSGLAHTTLVNSIIWNGFQGELLGENIDATYSFVLGGWPGDGNSILDPKVDENGTLAEDSPAIDSGLVEAAPITDLQRQRRGLLVDVGADERIEIDNDSDGLPDAWEMQKFGSLDRTGSADDDLDGVSNAMEYETGSDPDDFFDGLPPVLAVVSGDNQADLPGKVLRRPLIVIVTNKRGQPRRGVPVVFRIESGGGSLEALAPDSWTDETAAATDSEPELGGGSFFAMRNLPDRLEKVSAGENTMVTAITGINGAAMALFTLPNTAGAEPTISATYTSEDGIVASATLSVTVGNPALPVVAATAPNVQRDDTKTKVTVTWEDKATNETGFIVERSINGTDWTEVGQTAANKTSFTETGLLSDKVYFYRVMTISVAGTKTPSEFGASEENSDTDGDGLSNAEEALEGLNPNNKDQDGDNVDDGIDAVAYEKSLKFPRTQVNRYIVVDLGAEISEVDPKVTTVEAQAINEKGEIFFLANSPAPKTGKTYLNTYWAPKNSYWVKTDLGYEKFKLPSEEEYGVPGIIGFNNQTKISGKMVKEDYRYETLDDWFFESEIGKEPVVANPYVWVDPKGDEQKYETYGRCLDDTGKTYATVDWITDGGRLIQGLTVTGRTIKNLAGPMYQLFRVGQLPGPAQDTQAVSRSGNHRTWRSWEFPVGKEGQFTIKNVMDGIEIKESSLNTASLVDGIPVSGSQPTSRNNAIFALNDWPIPLTVGWSGRLGKAGFWLPNSNFMEFVSISTDPVTKNSIASSSTSNKTFGGIARKSFVVNNSGIILCNWINALWQNGRVREFADLTTDLTAAATDPTRQWTEFRANDINSSGVIVGNATGLDKKTHGVALIPAEIVPDWNRDRRIDDKDKGKVTAANPWRFWVNDDDDRDDFEGTDIPNDGTEIGYRSPHVRVTGRRDLVDLFPLHLNIKTLLDTLPRQSGYVYEISHEDEALSFIYSKEIRENASNYLYVELDDAAFGASLNETVSTAKFVTASNKGARLSDEFLDQISSDRFGSRGVILCEAVGITDKPLRLTVSKGGAEVCSMEMQLSFSGVEQMYRSTNLVTAASKELLPDYVAAQRVSVDYQSATRMFPGETGPPNNPDSINSNKWFIYVHGCCTSQRQARGWQAEIFKRMYWSGSRAKFLGITWRGDESTGWLGLEGKTPNYHQNVIYAFATGRALAGVVNQLPGNNKIIAGHSLGNVVVSTAINDGSDGIADSGDEMKVTSYYMTDAAVPLSAYNPLQLATASMRQTDWEPYPYRLWSANWYRLFVSTDNRSLLTWNGRFASVPSKTRVINYFSSGEEVLQNNDGKKPETGFEFIFNKPSHGVWGGVKVWAAQELSKGKPLVGLVRRSGNPYDVHGGWGFLNEPPPDLRSIDFLTDDQLRVIPVFLPFRGPLGRDYFKALHAPEGDVDAHRVAGEFYVRATLLAEAIPSLSFAAGSNEITFRESSTNLNIDMNEFVKRSDWPDRPGIHIELKNKWLHCDLKDMAYLYTFPLFDEWVKSSELK